MSKEADPYTAHDALVDQKDTPEGVRAAWNEARAQGRADPDKKWDDRLNDKGSGKGSSPGTLSDGSRLDDWS